MLGPSSFLRPGPPPAAEGFELPCIAELGAMAWRGFGQGWHERNGGNASYRLTALEAAWVREACPAGPWEPLGAPAPGVGGELFLVSATGSCFHAMEGDLAPLLGIVEVDGEGLAWRHRWGFSDGGRPTSEFAGHLLIHQARMAATDGAARVIYHAHPTSVVALSKLLPLNPRTFTRALWKAMTESVMVFPEGLGVVGCLVPGSLELARASAEQMRRFPAVIWASHGLLASGEGFDDAFGRMHAIVKAADIHLAARTANGGSDRFPNELPDATLRAIAEGLGLQLNEAFLGGEGA